MGGLRTCGGQKQNVPASMRPGTFDECVECSLVVYCSLDASADEPSVSMAHSSGGVASITCWSSSMLVTALPAIVFTTEPSLIPCLANGLVSSMPTTIRPDTGCA